MGQPQLTAHTYMFAQQTMMVRLLSGKEYHWPRTNMIEHPLVGDLSSLTIDELSEMINSLNKKMAVAARMGKYDMASQIQLALNSYRAVYNQKQRELFDETSSTIRGKIDITWLEMSNWQFKIQTCWQLPVFCDKIVWWELTITVNVYSRSKNSAILSWPSQIEL